MTTLPQTGITGQTIDLTSDDGDETRHSISGAAATGAVDDSAYGGMSSAPISMRQQAEMAASGRGGAKSPLAGSGGERVTKPTPQKSGTSTKEAKAAEKEAKKQELAAQKLEEKQRKEDEKALKKAEKEQKQAEARERASAKKAKAQPGKKPQGVQKKQPAKKGGRPKKSAVDAAQAMLDAEPTPSALALPKAKAPARKASNVQAAETGDLKKLREERAASYTPHPTSPAHHSSSESSDEEVSDDEEITNDQHEEHHEDHQIKALKAELAKRQADLCNELGIPAEEREGTLRECDIDTLTKLVDAQKDIEAFVKKTLGAKGCPELVERLKLSWSGLYDTENLTKHQPPVQPDDRNITDDDVVVQRFDGFTNIDQRRQQVYMAVDGMVMTETIYPDGQMRTEITGSFDQSKHTFQELARYGEEGGEDEQLPTPEKSSPPAELSKKAAGKKRKLDDDYDAPQASSKPKRQNMTAEMQETSLAKLRQVQARFEALEKSQDERENAELERQIQAALDEDNAEGDAKTTPADDVSSDEDEDDEADDSLVSTGTGQPPATVPPTTTIIAGNNTAPRAEKAATGRAGTPNKLSASTANHANKGLALPDGSKPPAIVSTTPITTASNAMPHSAEKATAAGNSSEQRAEKRAPDTSAETGPLHGVESATAAQSAYKASEPANGAMEMTTPPQQLDDETDHDLFGDEAGMARLHGADGDELAHTGPSASAPSETTRRHSSSPLRPTTTCLATRPSWPPSSVVWRAVRAV